MKNFRKYLLNCFLLLIPVLLWNVLFIGYLPPAFDPEVFWNDIPSSISYSENILRIAMFVLPAFMVLSVKTRREKVGLGIYLVGVSVYFLSWVLLIVDPSSTWSTSWIGFTAPAYTTIIWFTGIGLIGNRAFFKWPYPGLTYVLLALAFVVAHTTHAHIVFQRL